MMYEFQSKSGEIIEKYFKASGKIPKFITKNKIKYYRIISIPKMVMIDSKKPKTIGALAEKNTEKMLKQGKLKKKKEFIPWWRKNKKVDTSLAKMSSKQKKDYIIAGKK